MQTRLGGNRGKRSPKIGSNQDLMKPELQCGCEVQLNKWRCDYSLGVGAYAGTTSTFALTRSGLEQD